MGNILNEYLFQVKQRYPYRAKYDNCGAQGSSFNKALLIQGVYTNYTS